MRVILIAQSFPPRKGIATVRMTEVANQFAKNGYEVYAFTSNNYKFGPTDKFELDKRVKISRSDSWDFLIFWDKCKRFRNKLFGKKKQSQQKEGTTQTEVPPLKDFSYRFSEVLVYFFPFNLLFGEGSIIYILVTFIKSLRHTKNDSIIFTSFRTYSDHLIGYLLKTVRPGATWICDFRDPHLPPNGKGWLHRYQAWVNRQFFRKANVVTAVSGGILTSMEGYNKEMKVLRNGIVGELLEANAGDRNCFRIVYTGTLYEGRSDPSILFSCLKNLLDAGKIVKGKIEVVYAGKSKRLWDVMTRAHGIDTICKSYNLLPLSEVQTLQASASVNLLLTWCFGNYRGVLTGKIYEYFKVRKPIITLVSGERDEEIEEIMQQTGAGPVVYNDSPPQELENFILTNYNAFFSNQEVKLMDKEALRQFQWDYYFPLFLEELGIQKAKTRSGEKTLVSAPAIPD